MCCPKFAYSLYRKPAMRCVYNAADGRENRVINMNARLYDPVIGRFLSPDPYVQNPFFSQFYNRYAYVRNNPLIFTDRTGMKTDDDEWLLFLSEVVITPKPKKPETNTFFAAIWFGSGGVPPSDPDGPYGKPGGGGGGGGGAPQGGGNEYGETFGERLKNLPKILWDEMNPPKDPHVIQIS